MRRLEITIVGSMESACEDHPGKKNVKKMTFFIFFTGTLSISLTVGVVYTFWGFIFVFLVLALLVMGLTPLNPHQRQVVAIFLSFFNFFLASAHSCFLEGLESVSWLVVSCVKVCGYLSFHAGVFLVADTAPQVVGKFNILFRTLFDFNPSYHCKLIVFSSGGLDLEDSLPYIPQI